MSQNAVAILALAILVATVQWVWSRMAAHVDPQLIPVRSRRYVQAVRQHAAHVRFAAAVLVACAVCVQIAAALS